MKVIGLTGGTGSGKSIVSAFLEQNGAYIIDADEIAHGIIERGKPAYEELTNYFGGAILDQDRNILRKNWAALYSQTKKNLIFKSLYSQIYFTRNWQTNCRKKEKTKRYLHCIRCSLLLEAKLENRCNEIWVVFAEEEVRARRIMERDNITYQEAKNRIGCQKIGISTVKKQI